MTANIQAQWNRYSDAWRDISSLERSRLLKASVADDVTFTAPAAAGRGVTELTKMLEEFQSTYPGAYFETLSLIVHNNQSLAAWQLRDRTGATILTGNSYVRWNHEGRAEHLAGFWPS